MSIEPNSPEYWRRLQVVIVLSLTLAAGLLIWHHQVDKWPVACVDELTPSD